MADTFVSLEDTNWIKKTCIIQGNFKLKSGFWVSSYFDVHRVLSELSTRERLLGIMSQVMFQANKEQATILAGVESSGALVASFLAARHGLDFLLIRKGPRDYGTQKMIEGQVGTGQRVLLVDDVTSDGATAVSAVNSLKSYGFQVSSMIAVAYRGFGAEERLKRQGVNLWAAVFEPDTPTVE